MKKNVFSLFFFALFLFSSLFSQEKNKSLTLNLIQCESYAFNNNLSIQSAKLGLQTSQAKLTQANHAKILPKFELKNIWGPSPRARGKLDSSGGFVISPDISTSIPGDLRYFTQLDVDIIQPIFTFGKLKGLSEAAFYGVQAEQASLDKEKGQVQFQVRRLYWATVLGKELLTVVKDAEKELQKAEDRIEQKLDEDDEDVSQIDLYKVQLFRYEINKRLREASDNIELAHSALKTTLGLQEETKFEIASEYLDPVEFQLDSLSVYHEIAIQNRPELAQLRAGISARRALVQIKKSDYFPQFFLGGQVKYNFAKDRFDPKGQFIYNPTNYFRPAIVAGMNLNLNFLQTRDKVRVAEAEFLQLAEREKQVLDGIKLEIKKIYLEVTRAKENMRDSRKALKSSEKWLRSATMTFDIGVGEISDLIDAFKANGAMQAAHLENIFKFNVATAKLSKTVGLDLYPN